MKKDFNAADRLAHIPEPVCDEHPELVDFYHFAWKLADEHVKHIPGMPQSPYMDEAFCHTQIWIWDTCFMSLFCKYAPKFFPGVESLHNFYDVCTADTVSHLSPFRTMNRTGPAAFRVSRNVCR